MEPRTLFYLALGLVYLFIQYNRAKKKREEQAQRGRGNSTANESRPIQPPTPEKDRDTFKDIFERATQPYQKKIEPQKKAESKPQFAPPARREYEVVKPMKEEIDENYTDNSMQDMIKYEQPRELRTTVAAATVNYTEDVTNPILDNFDLRNALIAQIILERPEF